MKRLNTGERLELSPFTGDQSETTSRNERGGAITIPGRYAEPVEPTYRPLRASDFVELGGETLRFMQREKTGVSVVVLPVLIVAIRIALLWKGGAAAVELAQVELWALWAWSVLRIVF